VEMNGIELHTCYSYKPNDQLFFLSGSGILLYISTWLLSVFAPLWLIPLFYYGYYLPFTLLIMTVILDYIIDYYGVIKAPLGIKKFFSETVPRYFPESSLSYEHIPTKSEPTILCVHPHGIFCIGWGILFSQVQLSHIHFCFSSVLFFYRRSFGY